MLRQICYEIHGNAVCVSVILVFDASQLELARPTKKYEVLSKYQQSVNNKTYRNNGIHDTCAVACIWFAHLWGDWYFI